MNPQITPSTDHSERGDELTSTVSLLNSMITQDEARLLAGDFRIGITWQGRPTHVDVARRSLPCLLS